MHIAAEITLMLRESNRQSGAARGQSAGVAQGLHLT
jgi:hypothetical protein